jgi:hypothetical protein
MTIKSSFPSHLLQKGIIEYHTGEASKINISQVLAIKVYADSSERHSKIITPHHMNDTCINNRMPSLPYKSRQGCDQSKDTQCSRKNIATPTLLMRVKPI